MLEDGLTNEGGTIEAEILLLLDGARVEGAVRGKDEQPVAGATIVLIPDHRSRSDRYSFTTSDQNGHYEFPTVAPVSCKVFAWEDVETGQWSDPDFLKLYEDQRQKVVVDSKARSRVDLHVTTPPNQ